MSRLLDRILTNCSPFKYSLLHTRENLRNGSLEQAKLKLGDKATQAQLDQLADEILAYTLKDEPVITESFNFHQLENVPIFNGDDVAAYTSAAVPRGSLIADNPLCLAPPFKRFFVEFQNVPNDLNCYSWGCFVSVVDYDWSRHNYISLKENEKPRWTLCFTTFIEIEKNKPFGPVTNHLVGLAEDGTWFRDINLDTYFAGGLFGAGKGFDQRLVQAIPKKTGDLLIPIFFTIALMHCKNVTTEFIKPPEKLSKKFRKKHGRDLVRYHVLNIKPFKQLISSVRNESNGSFKKALHLVRSHFRTFTPDAPLFGKYTGTYFVDSHARGNKSEGVVFKDYNVEIGGKFGVSYKEAKESIKPMSWQNDGLDLNEKLSKGTESHNKTQNYIANVLREINLKPLSPAANGPDFDLAWEINGNYYVCEIKSIDELNEVKQLRYAVGQVIHYRQQLNSSGFEPTFAVIATEKAPADTSWQKLCDDEDILLIWPENAKERLLGLMAKN